jgi:hypothetical protein
MLYVVLDESDLCNKFNSRLLPKLRASIPDITILSVDEAKQGILKDYLAWFPLIVSDIDGDIDVFGSIKEDDWMSDVLVKPDPNYAKYNDKDIVDWYLNKTGGSPVSSVQSDAKPNRNMDVNNMIRLTTNLCGVVLKDKEIDRLCSLYDRIEQVIRLFEDNK